MVNERLRDALLTKGITPQEAAERLDVDPKTVERWITRSRTPYPKHRYSLAALLLESETYLWPEAIDSARTSEASSSEIVKVYPHRSAVPDDLWDRLLTASQTCIDIVVYVGMFMTEKPDLLRTMRAKARDGVQIRLLLGDRNSAAVTQRSIDEGIGAYTIAAKIDHALAYFRELDRAPGIDIRTHATTLYNSIYRFDDEMIVNTHAYGKIASHAPALHLRQLSAGNLFTTYSDSFTAVWDTAKPHTW